MIRYADLCIGVFYYRKEAMNTSKEKVIDGKVGKDVKFERIRRITGHLVGTIDRFNDGKQQKLRTELSIDFNRQYNLPNT